MAAEACSTVVTWEGKDGISLNLFSQRFDSLSSFISHHVFLSFFLSSPRSLYVLLTSFVLFCPISLYSSLLPSSATIIHPSFLVHPYPSVFLSIWSTLQHSFSRALFPAVVPQVLHQVLISSSLMLPPCPLLPLHPLSSCHALISAAQMPGPEGQ